jgi:hypothetical protein
MLGKPDSYSHHEPPEQLLDRTAASVPCRTAVVPSRGTAPHRTAAGRTVVSKAAPKEAVRRRPKEPAASLGSKATGNSETYGDSSVACRIACLLKTVSNS